MSPGELADNPREDSNLHKRTLFKLDCLLLPFLALLFLFNSLDKSNIGNAESAHFTSDIGLAKNDLNTAVALFFAFFVGLQPAGAALGRKYGMVFWVPSCMLLWGVATALHVWVRFRWQLYLLRIIIGILEAGFYPVTVSYLSLFYTRFEFGRRLSLFYGQAAVGGALGGLISYLVFSRFPRKTVEDHGKDGHDHNGWQSWQVLFLLEGSLTILVALLGYFWLPHGADTAWFLTPEERVYASQRVIQDRNAQAEPAVSYDEAHHEHEERHEHHSDYDEESRGLLRPSTQTRGATSDVIDDRGLSPNDIVSAFLSPRIWHLLICNVLSSIPVYAFQVFLPLVLAPLTGTPNPAFVNLMTAPPYVCGAITLYLFASYSDRHRKRLIPILAGLALLLIGLTLVVALPTSKGWAIPRYLALNVLLSGTFIASPLTVAWISGNTPSPGKRALLLGINGWGNLAGVFSALLFKPKYAEDGYIIPFWWTLVCVSLAAAGYVLFWHNLRLENKRRSRILEDWEADDVELERDEGRGPLPAGRRPLIMVLNGLRRIERLRFVAEWLEEATQSGRQGDEKLTFVYGL
ncbi:MFS general substrate transporter [Aaosphaeria arxii CBS 175.79]|uniref:MFS general substrate transporter n=1 Tax=Aaosphaeria arxii CBS 175.79 TaxID=1450172 RepID=A0A6A5X8J3_9PLEO|nr:MFS general substrate transporter [Aaosphaeria arxii CBS 175.79]KAF2009231.1 MFS general substrate transporter [Aaosphaeria arxii CBS 175.79]